MKLKCFLILGDYAYVIFFDYLVIRMEQIFRIVIVRFTHDGLPSCVADAIQCPAFFCAVLVWLIRCLLGLTL